MDGQKAHDGPATLVRVRVRVGLGLGLGLRLGLRLGLGLWLGLGLVRVNPKPNPNQKAYDGPATLVRVQRVGGLISRVRVLVLELALVLGRGFGG